MFLLISAWLLPLGLMAILASIQNARDNRADRQAGIDTRVQLKAQRIDAVLTRSALIIGAAEPAISQTAGGVAICESTLRKLVPARFAIYAGAGRPVCASPGMPAPASLPLSRAGDTALQIDQDGSVLRLALFDPGGRLRAVGEFSREALGEIVDLRGTAGNHNLTLSEVEPGPARMVLHRGYREGGFQGSVNSSAPVAGGRLQLTIQTGAVPISAPEALMILLPIIMWLAAAVIGWLIVDRFLLRPLATMQRAVTAYRPGDGALALPPLKTPAHEIHALGAAFADVTATIARHEAELEAAVDRQKRLVREVHHRVKNNLQVVASLLNLHARGATSEDVSAAYASIQRRVDALAVVHRNHYAELEENRGVALKPLISELGANLRATAPASAAHMQIRVNIEPYYVTQDVAVSVAFMITELVEFAMFCGAAAVSVTLEGRAPGLALLAIESDSLKGEISCDEKLFERFDRIITGLSRQLRSTIERDSETGRYSLGINVVAMGEA